MHSRAYLHPVGFFSFNSRFKTWQSTLPLEHITEAHSSSSTSPKLSLTPKLHYKFSEISELIPKQTVSQNIEWALMNDWHDPPSPLVMWSHEHIGSKAGSSSHTTKEMLQMQTVKKIGSRSKIKPNPALIHIYCKQKYTKDSGVLTPGSSFSKKLPGAWQGPPLPSVQPAKGSDGLVQGSSFSKELPSMPCFPLLDVQPVKGSRGPVQVKAPRNATSPAPARPWNLESLCLWWGLQLILFYLP